MEDQASINISDEQVASIATLPSPDSAIGTPEMLSPEEPPPLQNADDTTQQQSQEDEDSISESEMVVTGSMQFALTANAAVPSIRTTADDASGNTVINGHHSNSVDDKESIVAGVELPVSSAAGADANSCMSTAQAAKDSPAINTEISQKCQAELKQERMQPVATATESITPQLHSTDTSSPSTSSDSEGIAGLPSTVKRLVGPRGVEVYVVGTAHFSLKSPGDVITTIEKVRPDVVVLELCRARTAIIYLDDAAIMKESSNMSFAKMRTVLREQGLLQGTLYLLLLSVSSNLTQQLGMSPGGEFRAAVGTANKMYPVPVIKLGDRPISITIGRALAIMSPWARLKIAYHILTSTEHISMEDVEKCKNSDMIEKLLMEMSDQFPCISEVFVKERDMFLSNSLYNSCTNSPAAGNKAPQPRRIVGVVGIGHMKGIEKYWGKVTPEQIAAIVDIPESSFANRAVLYGARALLYGLVGFACYRVLPSAARSGLRASVAGAASTVVALAAGKVGRL